jgi:hypothetical protein
MLNVLGFWVELTLCRKMTVLNEILTIDVKPGGRKEQKSHSQRRVMSNQVRQQQQMIWCLL